MVSRRTSKLPALASMAALLICLLISPDLLAINNRISKQGLVDLGGKKLHVTVYEPTNVSSEAGCTTTLVLLHGLLSDSRAWERLIEHLREYRVVAFDLYGTGKSEAPTKKEIKESDLVVTVKTDAVDLMEVLKDTDSDPVDCQTFLVGHSYGALVILSALTDEALQASYPESMGKVAGAILISSPSPRMAKVPDEISDAAKLSRFEIIFADATGILARKIRKGVLESFADELKMIPQDVLRVLESIRFPRRHRVFKQRINYMEQEIEHSSIERIEQLASLKEPVFLICGNKDDIIPCDVSFGLQQQIYSLRDVAPSDSSVEDPPVSVVELAAKHSPQLEQSQELAKYLSRFTDAPSRFPEKATTPAIPLTTK